MASDETSQTGDATAVFVQRPGIPPRQQPVPPRGLSEIAAEYRAIVSGLFEPRAKLGCYTVLLRGRSDAHRFSELCAGRCSDCGQGFS